MKLPCLWVAEIPEEALPGWEALLGEDELARYHKASAPKRKLQFLATRVLLRRALSASLGGPAQGFQVTAIAGEAPRILGCPRPVRASIAHTAWAAAVMLAEEPCGVDIEDASVERDFGALAKTAFNASELAIYENRPGREAFYAIWCAKEAHYKAGLPCAWEGRLSYKKYRVVAATPLTGLKNLVIC
jgi:4'-phosphopantetheinyl transferase